MFLHLGKNITVEEKDIVGIFEMDKSTLSVWCRKYLSNREKNNKIVYVTQKLPKSFVVCVKNGQETVFVSPLMVSTLIGRMKEHESNKISRISKNKQK